MKSTVHRAYLIFGICQTNNFSFNIIIVFRKTSMLHRGDHHGRYRMLVGLTGVLDTTLCDKVCQ